MRTIISKAIFVSALLLLFGVVLIPKAHAAISSSTDTITTSRPSAAAPLNADQAGNATQIQVVDVPGSSTALFLASDSAVLQNDTGQTLNTGVIASMSAQQAGTPNFRYVYFTSGITNTHHKGTAVVVPVTATHKVQFTTTPVVGSGHIVLTFPGTVSTSASPSASTFGLNGLTSANASTYIQVNGATCTSWTISTTDTPTMDCLLDTTGITASTIVTILIGCTTQSSGNCTASSPRLINPTKSNTTAGVSDTWKLTIKTQDNNGIDQDTTSVKIATIESVQVQAQVDPTLTFTIAAVSGAINTGNTTGCTNTESVNSGIASTATNINLGLLSTATINIAAQLITISTNSSYGYALTATSSGHLINPASGVWIPDSTTPLAMTVNVPWFGIHPCGLNVTSICYTTTRNDATGGGTGAKYGWPTQSTAVTLASAATGPIGNTATTGGVGAGLTSVEYAAAVDVTVPAGIYTSVVTYVATPTF